MKTVAICNSCMQDIACDSFFDEFLIDEHKLTVSLLEVPDPDFTSLFTPTFYNYKKTKRILIALFLLSSFSIGGCSAQSTQEAELKDNENSLLWKISGNGLQHDSYLLGTMHNVHRTFLDSISGFGKAFKEAKQVAVECDMFTAESNRSSKPKEELKDYIFMPQDTTYAMLYNDDDYQFVDSIMRKGNRQYFKYKPLFWSNFLTKMVIYDSIKSIQSTMDGFILLIGYQNDKKICFMETLEDIGRKATEFDSLGYVMDLHDQAKMLQHTLRHPNSIRSFMDQMKKYYFKQALTQLSVDSLTKQLKLEDAPQVVRDGFKFMNDVLIAGRNEEWMSNIIPMIHEDSSLIAVGAGHLIGPDGLIAKLRERGYKVEPIR